MNKRILSLVLALVMVLGTFAVVSAEEAKMPEYTTQAQKIQWLIDNKIVEGHKINEDETELDLEGSLTREQASKLLVHLIGRTKLAENLQGSMKLFSDVDYDRWSNGVINVLATYTNDVNNQVIVMGYPDGTFQPANDVTYAELATMLVRVVKDNLTEDDVKYANDHWATQWMRWAAEEGILKGIDAKNYNEAVSRRDAFEMIYNTQYRLGKVKFNKVDFGDKMGIISKLQAGKVEINQDKSMTYNITYDTIFTDGTQLYELAHNNARPGSLVRLITDSEGNVLYMIELGNYRVGAIANRWETVADYTVSSMNPYTAKFVGTDAIKFHTGVEVRLMDDTRYFVADPANNFLKEIDSLTEAMKYYGSYDPVTNTWKNTVIKNVYAGYDKTEWGNEAKVVVFNTTHKSNTNYNLLRVYTEGVNSLHNVTLQETNGDLVNRNTANYFPTNWFPGNWTFDFMDVVEFRTVKESDNLYTKPFVVIDYSKDNVYEVVKINRSNRTIELKDEFNRRNSFVVDPYVAEFLENETKVGRHVQVSFNDKGHIDVISNVNLDLRGPLAEGVNPDLTKTVKLERVYVDANSYYAVVKDVLDKNVYGQARTYKLMGQKQYKNLKTLLSDSSADVILDVTLSVNDNGYQTPVVVEYEVKPFEIIPAEPTANYAFVNYVDNLPKLGEITNENYDSISKVLELRGKLEEAIELYKKVEDSDAKVESRASWLNNKINAFNALTIVVGASVSPLDTIAKEPEKPVEDLITALPEVPTEDAPVVPDVVNQTRTAMENAGTLENLDAIYTYLGYLENAEAVAEAKDAFDELDASSQDRVNATLKTKLDAAVAKIEELKSFIENNTTVNVGTYNEEYSGLAEDAKGRIQATVIWPFYPTDGFNSAEGMTSLEMFLENDKGEIVRNTANFENLTFSKDGNWPTRVTGSFDLGIAKSSSSGSWTNGMYNLSGDEVIQADLPDKVVVEFTYKGVLFTIEEVVELTPEMFHIVDK